VRALVQETLAAWREAERLAGDAEAGSVRQRRMLVAAGQLRQLYRDLTRSRDEPDAETSRERLAASRSILATETRN
jgi:hypothetical protein